MEPQKPFACTLPDCGMTFTNEDHLHVHTKKHDMVLQLGMEQKAAFVADQTPTPTRFIRNCEEVGLFQDLQNVNPFDEGFKRAMETKHGVLSLEAGSSTEDALHTPHLLFPLEPGDCALYTANNQRNITISRSSSDESGAVKEYETTTISKLTNEVTTISRVVGKDPTDRAKTTDDVSIVSHEELAKCKDGASETSVSYTNNVINIHSNVEIRKYSLVNIDAKTPTVIYSDIKDSPTKHVTGKKDKLPPIMSQKSLDFVVDSLTSDVCRDNDAKKIFQSDVIKSDNVKEKKDDYEVIIKQPINKRDRRKDVDENETTIQYNTKEKLKKAIKNKSIKNTTPKQIPNAIVQNIIPITAGTLIPVTVLNSPLPILASPLQKIPIVPLPSTVKTNYKSVKRKKNDNIKSDDVKTKTDTNKLDDWDKADLVKRNARQLLESRSAASRRYRQKLKEAMQKQSEENRHLREVNQKLNAERAVLKQIITQHLKNCPIGDDLRNIQEKLQHASSNSNTTDI
ncbi:uncharacterized protein LOC126779285 [Nymphalis io]|uniref:uncharacterized protein LOC126779285 n=1 Tax=Inachis io TaxID=171585 RepID=UPI002167DCA2|nr:uncharacterized protein LOC126779285 [Nymphalis io]